MAIRIKITVIKTVEPFTIFEGKVPNAPSGKKYEKCWRYTKGDIYTVNEDTEMPDGFCSWAWRDIYKDISVLAFGGNFRNWMEDGKMICCCTDGIRPVSFLLERIPKENGS